MGRKNNLNSPNEIRESDETDEIMTKEEMRPKIYKKERFVKNSFKIRPSFLDESSPDSYINLSAFKGFANVGKLLGTFMLIIIPIMRSLETGSFFKTEIFHTFQHDFLMLLSVWPFFYCWSYMAFIIQKIVLMGAPRWLILFLQHSCQSFIFIFTICVVLYRNWGVTHTLFIVLQTCAHFMKMHSYTNENRDLREKYLKDIAIGKKHSGLYPNNINWKNFNYFMFAPTLSYEAEYPRSGPFRPWYALHKMACALGCLVLEYIIVSEFVVPVMQDTKVSFLENTMKLVIYMIWSFIILFMFMFEYYLNFFAEITRFGDRQFYQDWWNSSGWDEWARKWNRPVHEFLYRNVYLEAINQYKLSPFVAQIGTFFFSALLHELVLALVMRAVRPFLIIFMLLQIPLIITEKKLKYKGTNFGNCFFWFGLILGVPLIINTYLRDEEISNGLFK